jgi:hypothetical protein
VREGCHSSSSRAARVTDRDRSRSRTLAVSWMNGCRIREDIFALVGLDACIVLIPRS